jgi:two-component system, OmpR family, sensor kinase
MSRIPIRLRLILPFGVAVAAVLAAMGAFIYVWVGGELLDAVDANLHAQVAEVVSNAREGHVLVDNDATIGPTVAQIRTRAGGIVATQPASLAPIQLRGRRFTAHVPGLKGDWRFVEEPARVDGRLAVVIVGRSLAGRAETLSRLERGLLIAAPAALALAVLLGYGLAAAALRPVEAMRRRAAAVSAEEPGRRLPVPPARDEIRSLAITLNDMLDRLEAAFEHERRFLSNASHELRTPLALLRAELELALRRPRSRAELEASVRSAAEETERLTRLAEDLLLVARADQGMLPVHRQRVEVEDLFARIGERFAARTRELQRELRADSPAVAVHADPLRLEQALGNLVANALDHGGGEVRLRAVTLDGAVELHVTDDGPGFPAGFAERAFDRFSRGDEAPSSGGAGLGLAIVQLIARAHGGDAHVANLPGGGSDVWITLRRVS